MASECFANPHISLSMCCTKYCQRNQFRRMGLDSAQPYLPFKVFGHTSSRVLLVFWHSCTKTQCGELWSRELDKVFRDLHVCSSLVLKEDTDAQRIQFVAQIVMFWDGCLISLVSCHLGCLHPVSESCSSLSSVSNTASC